MRRPRDTMAPNEPAPRGDAPASPNPARPDLGWAGLVADARELWGMYLIAPAGVTALLCAFKPGLRDQPGSVLAMSLLLFGLCCGLHSVIYAFALGHLVRRPDGRAAILARSGAIALGLPLGVEAALHIAAGLGLVDTVDGLRTSVLGLGLVVAALSFLVGVLLDRARVSRQRAEDRARALAQAAVRAQLRELEARTNPHFLFNTLNTIASLIEDRPQLAERAVEQLADLLRYSLDRARRPQVSLGQELTMVDDYLALEKLRYGQRIRVHIDVAPSLRALAVPPLIVQPLVENAIHHGLVGRRAGGTIWIAAERVAGVRAPDRLIIRVEDDGPGPGGSARSDGTGTCLADLRKRLTLAVGEAGQLTTETGQHGGFLARIVVPVAPATRAQARATVPETDERDEHTRG